MEKFDKNLYIERLRYRRDGLSFALTLLGLLFNVCFFVCLYKNNNSFFYSIEIGASVIYNLLFMLFTFLSAEEVKIYNRKYSILLIFLGLLQIARIFILPMKALGANTSEIEVLAQSTFTRMVIYLSLSCALLLAGGVTSFVKSKLLDLNNSNRNVTIPEQI